uniref:Ephrin RBD domain-containing protein n=1 Tax=Oryzias sinensis TaxID=183150 RepID=A0A8C7WVR8_9TELE
IYCPHYNSSQRGRLERVVAEQYILYMVNYHGYRSCDPKGGSKRWECNKPHAPHAPIKFSEKFQRYSAFSLGYEFNVGKEYYYISTPTHHHGHSCLRLRVYVCCSTGESSTPPPSSFLHLQPMESLENSRLWDVFSLPLSGSQPPRRMTTPVRRLQTTQSGPTSKFRTSVSELS